MKTNLKLLCALALALGLSACTTPSRQSKLENLKEGNLDSDIVSVLSDVKRSESLQVLEVVPVQKENPQAPSRKPVAYTVGMVEAYPLTNAIVDKVAENSVTDIAFKEMWSEKQIKDTIAQRKAEMKRHMGGNTCFALTMSAPKDSVQELKYWYGKLIQADKERTLSFYTEAGKTLEAYRAWEKKENTISAERVYGRLSSRRDVIACAAGKVDFTKEFKLVFEPRFERGIQKASLTWEKPKKIVE